ncbi:hypothetical protein FUAX_12240 [Fulvitalea axinellae]|uniref:Uncharacterized protein n=1 Tax=Fulvitalea axinellae TaxID=1182444 RepID=A0AAU9CPD7_9BACT|nr:hypothetical protein FUAX_12240 [Fulvitalea axinellae]
MAFCYRSQGSRKGKPSGGEAGLAKTRPGGGFVAQGWFGGDGPFGGMEAPIQAMLTSAAFKAGIVEADPEKGMMSGVKRAYNHGEIGKIESLLKEYEKIMANRPGSLNDRFRVLDQLERNLYQWYGKNPFLSKTKGKRTEYSPFMMMFRQLAFDLEREHDSLVQICVRRGSMVWIPEMQGKGDFSEVGRMTTLWADLLGGRTNLRVSEFEDEQLGPNPSKLSPGLSKKKSISVSYIDALSKERKEKVLKSAMKNKSASGLDLAEGEDPLTSVGPKPKTRRGVAFGGEVKVAKVVLPSGQEHQEEMGDDSVVARGPSTIFEETGALLDKDSKEWRGDSGGVEHKMGHRAFPKYAELANQKWAGTSDSLTFRERVMADVAKLLRTNSGRALLMDVCRPGGPESKNFPCVDMSVNPSMDVVLSEDDQEVAGKFRRDSYNVTMSGDTVESSVTLATAKSLAEEKDGDYEVCGAFSHPGPECKVQIETPRVTVSDFEYMVPAPGWDPSRHEGPMGLLPRFVHFAGMLGQARDKQHGYDRMGASKAVGGLGSEGDLRAEWGLSPRVADNAFPVIIDDKTKQVRVSSEKPIDFSEFDDIDMSDLL